MPVLDNSRWELYAQGVAGGKTQAQAYVDAGFAANDSNAAQLAKRPEVAARITEINGRGAERAAVTAERVIAEIAKIGFASIADYVKINNDGQPYYDFTGITPDQLAAIQALEIDQYTEGEDDDEAGTTARIVKKIKVKQHPKLAALELLAKHTGAIVDRKELTGANGGPIQLENQINEGALLQSFFDGLAARVGAQRILEQLDGGAKGGPVLELEVAQPTKTNGTGG